MNYPYIENAQTNEDLNHDCRAYLDLRTRTKATGTAYAYQCQFCGEYKGSEISKKTITIQPPLGDTDLPLVFEKKREELFAETAGNFSAIQPQHEGLYERAAKLAHVIEQCCAELNSSPSSLLPVVLYKYRHTQIEKNYIATWSSEVDLHDWFINTFSEWFEIHHEVSGQGFINRETRNIRIDFVIKAKSHLIEAGFTDQYIGVEVKHLNPKINNGFHSKSSRGVFQTLSYWYSGARWQLPGGSNVELASILLFTNLSFNDEAKSVFETIDSHYKTVWRSYLSIANHANVGELQIRMHQNKPTYWKMDYDGAKYFSWCRDSGFSLSNSNVINKRRIGSRSKKTRRSLME